MKSDPEIILTDEMRKLILAYMEACNAGGYAKSEGLLQKIKELGQIEHESKN